VRGAGRTGLLRVLVGNVLALGRHLAVPGYVAWLVAPAVDLTVVGLIVGVRHLSLRGLAGHRLRPARLLLIAAGLATLALNTAHGLFVRRHLGWSPTTRWRRYC
jgi:hypothetical protein